MLLCSNFVLGTYAGVIVCEQFHLIGAWELEVLYFVEIFSKVSPELLRVWFNILMNSYLKKQLHIWQLCLTGVGEKDYWNHLQEANLG